MTSNRGGRTPLSGGRAEDFLSQTKQGLQPLVVLACAV